jgi:hypothetical protein
MKMKKIYLLIYLFLLILNTSSSQIHKCLDYNIKKEFGLEKITSIAVSDIYNDTFFLMSDNKIFKYDLIGNRNIIDKKIDLYIEQLLKEKKEPSSLKVSSSGYFWLIRDKLFYQPFQGKSKKIYESNEHIVSFQVVADKIILATGFDNIILINFLGVILDKVKFNHGDAGFDNNFNDGLLFNPDSETEVTEFTVVKNRIQISKYVESLKVIKDKNFYIGLSEKNGFVGFIYDKRDNLFFLEKKANTYKFSSNISLKEYAFMPSNFEFGQEEGYPNFKIFSSNKSLYIVALAQKKLKIFKIEDLFNK